MADPLEIESLNAAIIVKMAIIFTSFPGPGFVFVNIALKRHLIGYFEMHSEIR